MDDSVCFSCKIPNEHQWSMRASLEDEVGWLGAIAERANVGTSVMGHW